MARVNIKFPGNLGQVKSAQDLRGVPSYTLAGSLLYLVTDLGSAYTWAPGSTATDDGSSVIRPLDLTAAQAGRWLFEMDGFAPGPAGPAGNSAQTLADLKAAPTTNFEMLYDSAPFTWTLGNYTGQADDINIIQANGIPLSTGAWVRQDAGKVAAGVEGSVADALAARPLTATAAQEITVTRTKGGQSVNAYARPIGDAGDSDTIDLRQFADGPIELENAFDLLNRATGANLPFTGNLSNLPRKIIISTPLVFPGENKSVFIPRGMILEFENGVQLDLSATASNTLPVFITGRQADGTLNAGGLPPRILYLNTIGGPSAAPVISFADTQGYTLFAPFITSAGEAIDLQGSGDGLIDMVQIDQCLTGILMGGQNNNIGMMNCYNNEFDVLVKDGTFDCGIDFLHTEYYKSASVQFDEGADDIKGFRINTHKGLQNAQYVTSTGFINIRSNNADIIIGNAEYRNGKGAAIRLETGLGNRLTIGHLFVDQDKTNPVYDQSTDMAAIDFRNGKLVVKSMDARRLSGQPVTIQGGFQTRASFYNTEFDACTGGTDEILMAAVGTGPGEGSYLRLRAVDSSRGVGARYENTGAGTIEDDLAP